MVSTAARKKKAKTSSVAASKRVQKPVSGRATSIYFASGALLVVVVLCYANALGNDFVFDDHVNLQNNPLLRNLSNVPTLLLSGFRPIREVSYALDFALWGERPFGFHLTNILIHAANAVLVFLLIRRFIGDVASSAIGALVFAIHPIQPDAVTYISGRRDVLFAFFYLASFHSYLAYRRVARDRSAKHWRRSALLYFALFLFLWMLGLMSKEMAASLPLVIFVWNFCDSWNKDVSTWVRRFLRAAREAFSRDKWLYIVLSLGVPAYGWYVIFIKGSSVRTLTGFNFWGGSFYTNLLTVLRVHAWYLKQLIFPTPIVQYYGAFDISTTLLEWRVILAILVVGGVIVAGFVLLDRNKLIAFAIFSYFVMLLPVSQIIPHHELLADHYLYLPLMSLGLLVAVLVQKLAARPALFRRITYSTAAVMLVVLMFMTFMRNRVYRNDLTVWQANYDEVPNSIRAVFNLGSAYADSYPARAAELYKRCIALDPTYAPAYVRLARLYQIREKAREVEELVQKGLTIPVPDVRAPGYDNPLRTRSELTTALAISKGFQGFDKEAEALLLRAIELYPANSQAYEVLTDYYHAADPAKEIELLKRQDAFFPNSSYTLQLLTTRLIDDRRFDDAIPYLERMLGMASNAFYANYQLGQIYRTKNECDRSGRYFEVAKRAASGPEDAKAIVEAVALLQQQCAGS